VNILKLSPSLLNDFYNFGRGWYGMDHNKMIDRVNMVKQVQTDKQLLGVGFEDAVRDLKPYDPVPETTMQKFYEATDGGEWQVKTELEFLVRDYTVRFTGYIDNLQPDRIIDIKTTQNYKAGKYRSNFQTPAYLLSTDLKTFDYLVTDFKYFYREQYKLSVEMVDNFVKTTNLLVEWMLSNHAEIDWSKRLITTEI
jgi:hypothetical protein